jgi:hypothetical protein
MSKVRQHLTRSPLKSDDGNTFVACLGSRGTVLPILLGDHAAAAPGTTRDSLIGASVLGGQLPALDNLKTFYMLLLKTPYTPAAAENLTKVSVLERLDAVHRVSSYEHVPKLAQ